MSRSSPPRSSIVARLRQKSDSLLTSKPPGPPLEAQAQHPVRQADALAAHLSVDVQPGGRPVLQRDGHHAQSSGLVLQRGREQSRGRGRDQPRVAARRRTPATAEAAGEPDRPGRQARGRRAPAEARTRSAAHWPTSGSTRANAPSRSRGPATPPTPSSTASRAITA